MTALRGPTALYEIARQGLANLLNDLEGDAPSRVTIYPGTIVWDECNCGMLAAAIDQTYTSDSFPTQSTGFGGCNAASYVGNVTWGIVRCSPQPPEDGIAPAEDELAAAALQAASDQWHLMETIDCLLAGLKDTWQIMDALVGRSVTVVQGDCMGSQITAQIQFARGKDG